MDKQKLHDDLINVAGHVISLYFTVSEAHYLAELAGRLDLHQWADNIRAGKEDGQNYITDLLDGIQEVIAIPLLEDGYLGSKDLLAKATSLTDDFEQNPKDIELMMAVCRKKLDDTGEVIAKFEADWGEKIRGAMGYKAKAFDNLLSTWCQYIAQASGWLIGFKGE